MDQRADTLLSPREAAKLTGRSRSSIMRALSSRVLQATRGNDGSWLIRREDLDHWIGQRSAPGPEVAQEPGPVSDRTMSEPDQATTVRLAAAEARAEMLSAQVLDLQAERDRLLGLVERLSAPKPGLLERLARVIGR